MSDIKDMQSIGDETNALLDKIEDGVDKLLGDSESLVSEVETEEQEPALKANELMRIVFGNALVSVMSNGDRLVRQLKRNEDASSFIVWSRRDELEGLLKRPLHADPTRLPFCETIGGFDWRVGLCIVMGPASVGKSPVLKWMVDTCNTSDRNVGRMIRFGEPLPGYITLEAEAALLLTNLLLDNDTKVIALDSMKDLLVSLSYGGTMARGVPRAIFRTMSQLGSIASSLGKLIVVPLNISTDDENATREVAEAVLSNSTAALIWKSGSVFNVSQRSGESKLRDKGTAELQFDSKGVPKVILKTVAPVEQLSAGDDIKSSFAYAASTPEVSALVAKMMRRASDLRDR